MIRTKIVEDLAKNQKQIHHKLLFGTDYPVPYSILFSHNSLSLSKRLELERIQNSLDRYVSFFNEYFNENSEIYANWKKLIIGDKNDNLRFKTKIPTTTYASC